MKRSLTAIVILLSAGSMARARQIASQTAAPQNSAEQSSTSGVKSEVPSIPAYPDSPEGLEHLMKDMLKLEKKGNAKDLAPYVQSLILPNPSAWFTATFGDEIGKELTAYYDRTSIGLPLSFPDMLAELASKHAGSPRAIRFTDSCNPNASDTEYPLLLRRANAQPIYDVRFGSGWQYFTMKYFAYSDGAFRWLGNFTLRAPQFPTERASGGSPQPPPVKAGGRVMAARRIKSVAPQYPPDALYNGIQGTVRWSASQS